MVSSVYCVFDGIISSYLPKAFMKMTYRKKLKLLAISCKNNNVFINVQPCAFLGLLAS